MKVLLACMVLAVAVASARPFLETEYQYLFTKFIDQHAKQYDDAPEFFKRFNVFKQNMDLISKHNSNPSRTFDMAMNKFGDMSNEEFRALYNHYRTGLRKISAAPLHQLASTDVPATVDWRTKNVVTAVKNQQQCGSCWAFSSTGSIESAHAIKTGNLISISEQQLVDCAGSYGNQGCNGGEMQAAFQFVQANGGLCTEADYPYKAVDGTCSKTCKLQFTISGFANCIANNETDLQVAVARQPISIAVDASGSSWQFYSGGVVSTDCGTSLDHGVLAVGYGTDNGVNYWLVKNSWGDSWGENGYIRIKRGTGTSDPGLCGIAMDGTYPIA